MSLPSWANTMDKKIVYGRAESLGAGAVTLSDFDVCSAFLEEKSKVGVKRTWLSWLYPDPVPVQHDSNNFRPMTPDFKVFVYGFVGLWEGGSVSVHGTACAISEKLVFTAYHNIKDNSLELCGLVKELRGGCDKKVRKSSIIELDLVAFDEDEDWALLSRRSGVFVDFCSALCSEHQLPSVGDYVAVFDFPVGLITATVDGSMKLSCDSMMSSVYQYEEQSRKVAKSHMNSWSVVEEELPLGIESVITVKGGRSIGSCGAPYFTMRGLIVGFHRASLNDGEDGSVGESSQSHTSYSCANVFCRLPKFVAEYKRQTSVNI